MGASAYAARSRVPQEAHCFVFHGHQTLLRRSLSDDAGKWHGFVAPIISQRPMHSAINMLLETGLAPSKLSYHGDVTYKIGGATAKVLHLFSARGFYGSPLTAPHFKTEWFGRSVLPIERMERDILMWLAYAREGKAFSCSIDLPKTPEPIAPKVIHPAFVMGSVARARPIGGMEQLQIPAHVQEESGFSFRKLFFRS